MKLQFYKYQGTGNDFVLVDNRHNIFGKYDAKRIAFLCDRKFGIGADGLILLEDDLESDFKMIYFNSDGHQSSMCGNGGRCIVAFAKYLGIIDCKTKFNAIDGMHHAEISNGQIHLEMQEVTRIEKHKNHTFLDTGSPHHVEMIKEELERFEVQTFGAKIRYNEPYANKGVNVNFVNKISDTAFAVRTYERGVEDETLSCGTGVTAVALSMHNTGETEAQIISLKTQGGELKVSFSPTEGGYNNIKLIGPAVQVFKGEIEWKP
ncbi:MAG: diaminopimelate epimerase [Bacteroidota bacterium]